MEKRCRGEQFDRLVFCGAVAGYSCVVRQHRVFKDGCGFFLSDHFPLMSFLDLHVSHAAGVAAKAIARRRVLAVGRVRDIYAAQETQNSKEKEKVGREEAALRRAQAADRDRGEVLKKWKEQLEREEKERRKLVDKALVPQGLFGYSANSSVRGEVPETLRSVVLAQLAGLFGGGAEEVWSTSGIRHPIYAGFWNPSARMSFAAFVCQLLLRIPSFAIFLQAHVCLLYTSPSPRDRG